MKKVIVIFTLLFFPLAADALVFDLLKEGVDTVSNSTEKVFDKFWKNSMLAQTITSAGQLKKNYDESAAFYEEMKTISNNPNSILDYTAKRFEERGNDIMYRKYTNAEREFISAQDDPGVLGRFQDRSTKYIQDNLDFSEKVLEHNKQREKQFYDETVKDSNKKDKETVERAKTEAQMATLETLISIEKLNARSLQTMTALYDYMKRGDRESYAREIEFQKQLNALNKQMREGQKKQSNSSVDALNKILK
ncbi:MAG: hypothetical protein ABII64_01960 [Elusimicrobiota bacterium]